MAGDMPRLKAFVHVSTAYVNGNQPKGSTVPEQQLPLQDRQGQTANACALVAELQCLPREQATKQVHVPATRKYTSDGAIMNKPMSSECVISSLQYQYMHSHHLKCIHLSSSEYNYTCSL